MNKDLAKEYAIVNMCSIGSCMFYCSKYSSLEELIEDVNQNAEILLRGWG